MIPIRRNSVLAQISKMVGQPCKAVHVDRKQDKNRMRIRAGIPCTGNPALMVESSEHVANLRSEGLKAIPLTASLCAGSACKP